MDIDKHKVYQKIHMYLYFDMVVMYMDQQIIHNSFLLHQHYKYIYIHLHSVFDKYHVHMVALNMDRIHWHNLDHNNLLRNYKHKN